MKISITYPYYSGATNEATRNHKIVMASLVGGACLATLVEKKKIEAKTEVSAKSEEAVAELPIDEAAEKKTEKGFRKKKLMQYENKIRRYAQPDKVFRYFATVQACYPGAFTIVLLLLVLIIILDGKKEDIYMTPDDFVRSLTPDGELQPQDCLLDRFRTVKTAQVSFRTQ